MGRLWDENGDHPLAERLCSGRRRGGGAVWNVIDIVASFTASTFPADSNSQCRRQRHGGLRARGQPPLQLVGVCVRRVSVSCLMCRVLAIDHDDGRCVNNR